MTATEPQGTNAELPDLLTDVFECTRVWSAWSYGTMTEDDFEPAAETALVGDLIAWKDAAVAKALADAGAKPQEAPSLGQRVTSVLTGAGWRDRHEPNPERFPAFALSDADAGGVMVAAWWASAAERPGLLGKYAETLRADGLKVDERVGYLYVHAPATPERAKVATS